MCCRDENQLQQYKFHSMIVDEGHRLKNEKIILSAVLRRIQTNNRLLLTGTPFQNRLHELWALLNFVEPQQFCDSGEFDQKYTAVECRRNATLVKELHDTLQPLMLRRLKGDVAKELLPKLEFTLKAKMSQEQEDRYKAILRKNLHIINAAGKVVLHDINNLTIELRKCANHPKLMDKRINITNCESDLINNCGKMKVMDKLLIQLKRDGSRVLIFSQMRRMISILEKYCIWREFDYCRLDGSTKYNERPKLIDQYNAPKSRKFIFLSTTRAGGLGINLSTADVVIIYDMDWNPQMDLQAIDRVHRIGQTKQVRVYYIITIDTVEERLIRCAGEKLRLDELIIQQGQYTHSKKKMLATMRQNAKKLLAK